METGHQGRFLAGLIIFTSACANADRLSDPAAPDVFPDPHRRTVTLAQIDTENFEVGISGGLFTIEDFESASLTVANLRYHITEDFFLEGRYGQSTAGRTSFERLSGAAELLTDEERSVQFYDLSLGYNLLPGEAFVGSRWAFSTGLYAIGGIGAIEFAGDQTLATSVGMSYRMVANDTISVNFTVRDHIFDTEITGVPKTTHNVEVSLGLSIFF